MKRYIEVSLLLLCGTCIATSIEVGVDQGGNDIICTGPTFVYQHDVRQHGIDENISASGYASFVEEDTENAYASFYTDNNKFPTTSATFVYTFVAESGKMFADVSVLSRAYVHLNAGSVIGEYQVDNGSWVPFYSLTVSDDVTELKQVNGVYGSVFRVKYTVNWDNGNNEWLVQLFRSSNPVAGQPGDYAFTFNATLVENEYCHRSDLLGEDLYINFADIAELARNYGKSGTGLTGDIDNSGNCDLEDFAVMASWWLSNCYSSN